VLVAEAKHNNATGCSSNQASSCNVATLNNKGEFDAITEAGQAPMAAAGEPVGTVPSRLYISGGDNQDDAQRRVVYSSKLAPTGNAQSLVGDLIDATARLDVTNNLSYVTTDNAYLLLTDSADRKNDNQGVKVSPANGENCKQSSSCIHRKLGSYMITQSDANNDFRFVNLVAVAKRTGMSSNDFINVNANAGVLSVDRWDCSEVNPNSCN